MARQSHSDADIPLSGPAVILTRPSTQGQIFAADLRAQLPKGWAVVESPLLKADHLPAQRPEGDFSAVLFTSGTAVAATASLGWSLPDRAYCVGDRTADLARAAGFDARSAAGDADTLVQSVLADPPDGPLLHLRGEESRGEVAARLTAAGLPTVEAVVYRQVAQDLTAEARAALGASGPVIFPVFSPRTAEILAGQLAQQPASAPLCLIGLSPAVLAALRDVPAGLRQVASRADAPAMLAAIQQSLRSMIAS